MNVIEAIHYRHSYRGKYKSVPVPRDDLVKIMQAGLAAPSGCNKQTTSLIATDDPETLAKLHRVIEPPVGETAPAAICVLTQRINAYRNVNHYLPKENGIENVQTFGLRGVLPRGGSQSSTIAIPTNL